MVTGNTAQTGMRRAFLDGLRLARLTDYEQRRLWGMRIASAYAVWIGIAGGVLMLAVASDAKGGPLGLIVVRSVGWLTWIAGGLALWSAAGACANPGAPCPVAELAALRGYSRTSVERGRSAAVTFRVAYLIAVPSLALASLSLGWARSVPVLLWTGALCAAVLAYSLVLGTSVALLARVACALWPRHARATALALVVVPHLAHLAWPRVPSVLTLFAWLLERLLYVGAMTA